MATDLIRYDLLVQDAFREIFRKVLTDIAAKGLPGEHHFLVTFRTGAPGVKISDRLRQRTSPGHDDCPAAPVLGPRRHGYRLFEVGLSFKNVAGKAAGPLLRRHSGFFDPSVNFGAEFTLEPTSGSDGVIAAVKPLALASVQASAGPRIGARGSRRRGQDRAVREVGAQDIAGGKGLLGREGRSIR